MAPGLGTALLAALIATPGCYAYRRATLTPEAGSRVRIVFTSAVAVTTTAGVHPGVLEASGTITAAAADTLALRLGELRTAAGPVPDVAGRVALLPTARIARIEQRRFQAGTTALTGIGVLTLALATYLILVITAITHSF